MKRFLLTLALFGLLFFAYDKIFILLRNRTPKLEFENRLELLLNGKLNKDMIIMGSSRGSRDLIASLIEAKTGLSTYNLSYLGSTIEFHEFLLRTLLQFNKAPKTILLVIDDPLEVSKSDLAYRFDRLYPLMKYEYVRQEMVNKGKKNAILSRFFVLHQINRYDFGYGKEDFTEFDTIMVCGSMPLSFQSDDNLPFHEENTEYLYKNEVVEKLISFKNFIQICKNHEIKLILISPPNLQVRNKLFESRIKELSGSGVNFFAYNDKNPAYRNTKNYHDEWHLMRKGADIFTNDLILYLKTNL